MQPHEKIKLNYDQNLRYGYFPVDLYQAQHNLTQEDVYNKEYFAKYQSYEHTPIGDSILSDRISFVESVAGSDSKGIDYGIGSGAFVNAMSGWVGFDVNPYAIEYLKQTNRFIDPYKICPADLGIECATFWDVFEHIKDLECTMLTLPRLVVLSIPIFDSEEHVLRSKHFRKDEHFHYFSETSLIRFFNTHDYELVAKSDFELKDGREDILSFAFKRT